MIELRELQQNDIRHLIGMTYSTGDITSDDLRLANTVLAGMLDEEEQERWPEDVRAVLLEIKSGLDRHAAEAVANELERRPPPSRASFDALIAQIRSLARFLPNREQGRS